MKENPAKDLLGPISTRERVLQRQQFYLYMREVRRDPSWHTRPAPGFTSHRKDIHPNEALWTSWFEEARRAAAQSLKQNTSESSDSSFFAVRLGNNEHFVFAHPSNVQPLPKNRDMVPVMALLPSEAAVPLPEVPPDIPAVFLPTYLKLTSGEKERFRIALTQEVEQLQRLQAHLKLPENRDRVVPLPPFQLEVRADERTHAAFLPQLEALLGVEAQNIYAVHNKRVQAQLAEGTKLQ